MTAIQPSGDLTQQWVSVRSARGVRMVHALAWFWSIAYRFREGLTWITAAYTAAPDTPGPAAAEALALAGTMALNLTRWEDASVQIQRSLDRSAADGDRPRARALSTSGLAAHLQNRPDDVRRFSEQAVEVARARAEPFELSDTLAMSGTSIALAHDAARGIELADESVEVARTLGNDWALVMATQSAGITRYRTEPARAVELIQASLDLPSARALVGTAIARFMKGLAHLTLGDDRSAAAEIVAALPLQLEVGEEYYITMEIAAAAVLLRRHGQRELPVRILGLISRLRDEGRIFGSPRDIESQEQLKLRLGARSVPSTSRRCGRRGEP